MDILQDIHDIHGYSVLVRIQVQRQSPERKAACDWHLAAGLPWFADSLPYGSNEANLDTISLAVPGHSEKDRQPWP